MWDNIGQVKSDNYSVLFLPDFYRYFGAPLKMREHMYVHICMYICIYMYVCPDPIRCSDPIRSRWLVPKLRSYKAEQLFGIQLASRLSNLKVHEAKKKGSSKAPLFPPTILATFRRRQPSRCFLVYLDNSYYSSNSSTVASDPRCSSILLSEPTVISASQLSVASTSSS